MTSVSRFLIEQLVTAYQQGRRLGLFFDYDGTLTPFAARPELARLDPAPRGALARLAAAPRVFAGVISGRALEDLKAMVGLPGLDYGGSWGLKLESRGRRLGPEPPAHFSRLLAELAAATEARLPAYPGAWVEKKAWGLTLHYRQANPGQLESLRAEFLTLLAPRAAAVRFYQAPLAIEVLPATDSDKGTALRALVAHAGVPLPCVLYAGDAANDAAALAAAAALGGFALGVGPEPPVEAVYRLPDTSALSAFLSALADTLTAVRSIV